MRLAKGSFRLRGYGVVCKIQKVGGRGKSKRKGGRRRKR